MDAPTYGLLAKYNLVKVKIATMLASGLALGTVVWGTPRHCRGLQSMCYPSARPFCRLLWLNKLITKLIIVDQFIPPYPPMAGKSRAGEYLFALLH